MTSSRASEARRFTGRLRAVADPIWQAQHDHPFVRAIGDGSVDMEQFRFWVR